MILGLGNLLKSINSALAKLINSITSNNNDRKNDSATNINSYIYLHHTDTFVLLPVVPESISDSMQSTFASTNPLARSAPIFAYSYSGPRTVQVTLNLHRDIMTQVNYGVSNLPVEIGDDYVDTIIKQLQSISVPRYSSSKNEKMVNPPMVSLRFGNEIFIKGIVSGNVSVEYKLPILTSTNVLDGDKFTQMGDKYAQVSVSFTISEIDPYDADTIAADGSFRGISNMMKRFS